MFEKRLPITIGVALLLLIAGAFLFASPQDSVGLRRQLTIGDAPRILDFDPKTINFKSPMQTASYVASASDMSPATSSNMVPDTAPDSQESAPDRPTIASDALQTAGAPESAPELDNFWCSEPNVDRLPYTNCDANDIIYRIPLFGGMTNAIKLVLLGAIQAFEENRCFFVDEGESHLNNFDRINYHENGFISHYFERIGISNEDPLVQKALRENRIRSLTWQEVWEPLRNRRMYNQLTSIPSLGYENVPGHEIKTLMMKRLWRPLPAVREATCNRFYKLLGRQEFLAISVRRGDKSTTENFDIVTMDAYIQAAEVAIRDKFDNIPPVIFVATDDCSVLPTLQSSRPTWRFVSECDNTHQEQEGFDLKDMKKWGPAEYDEHYGKFFSELYAMTASKYWIGVAYTNVSWFVYFMRGGKMENFELLDAPAGTEVILQNW